MGIAPNPPRASAGSWPGRTPNASPSASPRPWTRQCGRSVVGREIFRESAEGESAASRRGSSVGAFARASASVVSFFLAPAPPSSTLGAYASKRLAKDAAFAATAASIASVRLARRRCAAPTRSGAPFFSRGAAESFSSGGVSRLVASRLASRRFASLVRPSSLGCCTLFRSRGVCDSISVSGHEDVLVSAPGPSFFSRKERSATLFPEGTESGDAPATRTGAGDASPSADAIARPVALVIDTKFKGRISRGTCGWCRSA